MYSSTTGRAEEAKKSSRNSEVTAAENPLMIVLLLSCLSVMKDCKDPHPFCQVLKKSYNTSLIKFQPPEGSPPTLGRFSPTHCFPE